jgi:hypothetical protein
MAPALVETQTATSNSGPVPASVYKLDLGQYKEIDLTYIDKDAEEGKSNGPAAKVSRSLRPEDLIPFIMDLILTRNT